MKMLTLFTLILSLKWNIAMATSNSEVHILSKETIDTLANSMDRIVPKFREFQEMTKGKDSYSLYLSNVCKKEIVVYVKYLDLDGNWIEAGFWTLKYNKEIYIGETRNTYYYPGAYSSDGSLLWGDIPIVFKGYDLFVSEQVIDKPDWGEWEHSFSCDGA